MCVVDAFWLVRNNLKRIWVWNVFLIFFGCWKCDGLLLSAPPRNLNKHGGCELCASAGLWLADGCVINHGWGFAGVVPALANDIPPLPITFINNHNSSRIIITETYPGFPSVWKMMNETRAMMNCDKKKWARGSDLFYLQLPPTVV